MAGKEVGKSLGLRHDTMVTAAAYFHRCGGVIDCHDALLTDSLLRYPLLPILPFLPLLPLLLLPLTPPPPRPQMDPVSLHSVQCHLQHRGLLCVRAAEAGGWAPPSALLLGAVGASVSGAAQNVLIAKLSAVSTPGECSALH